MTSNGNTMIEKANPEMLCAEMTKLKKKTDTLVQWIRVWGSTAIGLQVLHRAPHVMELFCISMVNVGLLR